MLLCQVLLGIVSGEEVGGMTRMNLTRFVYTACLAINSLLITMSLSPGARQAPFTGEIYFLLIQIVDRIQFLVVSN